MKAFCDCDDVARERWTLFAVSWSSKLWWEGDSTLDDGSMSVFVWMGVTGTRPGDGELKFSDDPVYLSNIFILCDGGMKQLGCGKAATGWGLIILTGALEDMTRGWGLGR